MKQRVIGQLSQIPKGEGRVFDVQGVAIAIFRTRTGEVFASQARCPHRFGPLADGLVGNATVICPLHDRSFDLRTGEGPDCTLRVYPVRLTPNAEIVLETESLTSLMAGSAGLTSNSQPG